MKRAVAPEAPPTRQAQSARSTRLTLPQIIDAAKDVLQEHGVEGFTFRRLTAKLGVSIAATYHHVENKDALLRLVAIDVNSHIELPGPECGDWAERYRIAALRMREEWIRYPGMARYSIDHLGEDPSELTAYFLQLLRDAGFSEPGVRRAATTLFYYAIGAALADGFIAHMPQSHGTSAMQRYAEGLDTILRGLRLDLEESLARPVT